MSTVGQKASIEMWGILPLPCQWLLSRRGRSLVPLPLHG